jgi:hypothetical protein
MEIDKQELLHPLVQIVYYALLAALLAAPLPADVPYICSAPYFFAAMLCFDLGNLSVSVRLRRGHIVKGLYVNPLGFITVRFRLAVSDIQELILRQNADLYFELIALTPTHEAVVLKTMANRIPAEQEWEKWKAQLLKVTPV